MTLQENITLSICCLTYNHKGTIEKAINSFLMQKTDFMFEIFIHDDASNDGSTQIIESFQKQHPNLVRTLTQPENQYSRGKSLYEIYTRIAFPQLRGKYIAICEGDDYWTDPLKLQKQVDFLETNPDYSFCFHNAGFTGDTETDYNEHANYFRDVLTNRSTFDFSDLIRNNFIPNCTVVYRNCIENFPELFKSNVFPDWPLHIIFLQNGKIGYISEMMAVHHKRSNGIWEGLSMDFRIDSFYRFYYDLLIFAGENHRPEILNALQNHANANSSNDPKTLLDLGFSLGLKQQSLQNDALQSELSLIYTSYTWKTANYLRIISEKILPKETVRRKLAAKLFHAIIRTQSVFKNVLSDVINLKNQTFRKLKIVKVTNKPWPVDKPLVSIIIPNYNYGKYIEETIASILDQTFTNFEVIVVVGGSDDPQTLKVLGGINHPKVKVYHRQERHFVVSNRNYGIEKALGKYMCCLDADDIIEPTYLEKAMFYLETLNFDVVYPWVQSFGDDTVLWKTETATYEILTQSQNVVAGVAVYRRKVWKKAGGFKDYPIGKGYVAEDWEFWARIAGLGFRFVVIPEPLMRYRVHHDSMWRLNKTPLEEMLSIIRSENQYLETLKYQKKRKKIAGKSFIVKNPFINLHVQKTKKRLLVALPFMVVGGVDTLFLNVFGHLSQFYEITFYTTNPFGDEYGDNTSYFQKITSEIYHLPRFLNSEKDWEKFIIHLIQSRNFDCMFLAGSSFTYEVLPLIKKNAPHLPVVDFLFNEKGHIENNRKYSHLIAMNIVENEKIEQLLLLNHHEKPEKIRLIHNGVNIGKFSKKANSRVVKEKYALKECRFLVAFLGRFSEEKNPFAVIEIAKKLKNQQVEFFMGGHGPIYNEVVEQINENHLQETIKTPGFVETIEILSVADVLILPSTLDGRPNIVLEAMAMGVPVIATNVGGLPGIITHGETGFLFNPDDLEGFAQTILKLKNDPLLRETLGKAARFYAKETLSDTFMHKKWEQVIEDMIGK